jgi:nucleoside-diphosphate-sugar epimerase
VVNGEVFNVGGDRPISHRQLTSMLVDIAGAGRVEYVEWPAEKKAIDIGSFYTDSSKFTSATGWTAAVTLADGLRRTVDFYREHFAHYLDAKERGARV